MLETEAIDQLQNILKSINSFETEAKANEKEFNDSVDEAQELRYKVLRLLALVKPNVHTCKRLIAHISSVRSKPLPEQFANLQRSENIAMRLDRLIASQKKIVSELTRRWQKADVLKMTKEQIVSRVECLRMHIDRADPELGLKDYLEVLETRLSHLEQNASAFDER